MGKLVDRFEEYVLTVLMPVMVLIVFAGTVGRYSGWFSLAWYEEAARYIMIWLVFIGISAAAKKNAHFAVEVIFMVTPKAFHKAIRGLIVLLAVFFCGTVCFLSFGYLQRLYSMHQISPSLEVPIWTMYSAIPIGCLLMLLRTLQYYWRSSLSSTPLKAEHPEEYQ
nr:TRAP transporter small permease [uncultured Fretibacterium sp.]